MITKTSIFRAAVVVMTFCALFMVSCQEPAAESSSLEVSVKTPVVDSGKGQMFVNVKCDGRWTLALTDAVDGKDVPGVIVLQNGVVIDKYNIKNR